MASFLDDDDTFTELADEEKRRDDRRKSSAPLVRLLLLGAGVIVVVLLAGLLIRSWLHNREVASYSTYVSQVSDILKQSDASGRDLSRLLLDPGQSTRKDLTTRLDQHIAAAEKLTKDAQALTVPSDLKEAQQWFVAAMQLRSGGLQDLKPALLQALDVQDTEVSSETIARAMLLLVLSDVVYDRFFVTRATEVLKERQIAGATVGTTNFITDSSLSAKAKIKEILTAMRSSETMQTVHGLALKEVRAMPADKVIERDGTYNLQSTDQLKFVVTVENQGNVTEKDIPVQLSLSVASSTQPQSVGVKIPELKAKETKKITITGVNPTPYGEKALLKVTVGPVKEEKNTANNKLEAHLIFIL
jgi:CARDB